LAIWEAEIKRIAVQIHPGQIVHKTSSSKPPEQKLNGGMAQVVQHLLGKCEEVLSSNLGPAKINK
jgi:hypothetical protein